MNKSQNNNHFENEQAKTKKRKYINCNSEISDIIICTILARHNYNKNQDPTKNKPDNKVYTRKQSQKYSKKIDKFKGS